MPPTERVWSLTIDGGLFRAPMHRAHEKGRNWVAIIGFRDTVEQFPNMPHEKRRWTSAFITKVAGCRVSGYRYAASEMLPWTAIEIGADHVEGRNDRTRERLYGVCVGASDGRILLVERPTAAAAILSVPDSAHARMRLAAAAIASATFYQEAIVPFPTPSHPTALAAVARRFRIPEQAVAELVSLPPYALKERDRYIPPSNTLQPTEDYDRLPVGSAKIGLYGPPEEAYVEYLRAFAPEELIPTEAEDGIRARCPAYQRYVQWFREGREPPPICVNESARGDGLLLTTSRRRTLAAREAGIRRLVGWCSPHNLESGLPLKYKDVLGAYSEALDATAIENAA